jgi:hypothetical protein
MGIPNSDESTQSSNMETVINNRICVSESRQTPNQTIDNTTNDDSQTNNGKHNFDNFCFKNINIFIDATICLKIQKLFQKFLILKLFQKFLILKLFYSSFQNFFIPYFKTFLNIPYFKTFLKIPYFKTFELRNPSNIV